MNLELLYQTLQKIQTNLKKDGYIHKELIVFIINDIELNKNIFFVYFDKNTYSFQRNDDYIAFPLHYIALEYQIENQNILNELLNQTKIKPITWNDFYSNKKNLTYLKLEQGVGELSQVLF